MQVGLVSFAACLALIFGSGPLAPYDHICSARSPPAARAAPPQHLTSAAAAQAALGVWWIQGVVISFIRDFFSSTFNGYLFLWIAIGLAGWIASTRTATDVMPVSQDGSGA